MALGRRGLIGGLVAALAAPAIVRPGLLMPVRPVLLAPPPVLTMSLDDYSRRVLAPMVNNLAGAVAVDIMLTIEEITREAMRRYRLGGYKTLWAEGPGFWVS